MSLIAKLIEAGTPAELVEEVAMLLAEKRVASQAIEKRRAADRERQARRRASEDNVMSRDITGDDVTERDPSPSPFPKENNQTPTPTPTHETKTRTRKGHRLPEDWEPNALTGDTARTVAAWPPGAIERELAKFRDWAASANGPNALKKDWDAAWRNWLRKADEDGRYARKSKGNHDDKRDGAMRALDRQLGLEGASCQTGRYDTGEGGSYLALTAS